MSPSVFPLQTACVLYGANDLRVEERTLWPPQRGECQVAIMATGLCGSDLHYYKHGRNGDFELKAPMVLGHEAAGIITEVGPGVEHLHVGQRVAIEAGVFCQECSYCLEGRYNLCTSMRFCSSAKTFPHLDGTLQTRMNHPAAQLHLLPDTCSYEQAALAEPLSVVIHAARRVTLSEGQSVLVLGAGSVGLLACALAKAAGASRVAAIDIDAAKLDFAEQVGFAGATYCPPRQDRPKTHEEALKRAKENATAALTSLEADLGFDVVFECTGVESCIQMAIHCARTGGKVALVGMGTRNAMLPLSVAACREVDLVGVFRYAHTYPTALTLLSTGKLKGVERMVTQRLPLEQANEAFQLLSNGKAGNGELVLKVMVGPTY
jgi:L-iditol 2-dehydrogenase